MNEWQRPREGRGDEERNEGAQEEEEEKEGGLSVTLSCLSLRLRIGNLSRGDRASLLISGGTIQQHRRQHCVCVCVCVRERERMQLLFVACRYVLCLLGCLCVCVFDPSLFSLEMCCKCPTSLTHTLTQTHTHTHTHTQTDTPSYSIDPAEATGGNNDSRPVASSVILPLFLLSPLLFDCVDSVSDYSPYIILTLWITGSWLNITLMVVKYIFDKNSYHEFTHVKVLFDSFTSKLRFLMRYC